MRISKKLNLLTELVFGNSTLLIVEHGWENEETSMGNEPPFGTSVFIRGGFLYSGEHWLETLGHKV